jgi:histidine triad (HIT) family protein
MVLSKEKADIIKKQLLKQVETLPQENKEQIKEHIERLNEEQLEEFLKQNKIDVSEEFDKKPQAKIQPECVFCEIIKNKIHSYKIAENKKSIAILEINPLSKGHSIILPLKHIKTEELPKSSLGLAQKIAKKIKKKLKPEDVKIETSSFQGHSFINIIPIYKEITLKKYQASESELKQLQKKLETKSRTKRTDKETNKTQDKNNPKKSNKPEKKLPQISFRIPR